MTISKRIEIARNLTAATASIKDYKIRNKHNLQMRELARELMSCKGYIIASTRELKEKYGDLSHYDAISDDKHVWGISMNLSWNEIQFAAI